MPTYDYRCESCGVEFEVFQKISDQPLTICPTCESTKLKKVIKRSNFILKGKGWFKDGY